MEEDDIRTWEAGDETSAPDEIVVKLRTSNPFIPTPETEAEEI